jgi:hypothetical protein
MKKIILALAVLILAGPALAGPADTSDSHWVIQAQGGPDFLLSNTINGSTAAAATVNSPGWGFNGSLGYAFSKDFSLSVLTGYQVSTVSVPSAPSSLSMSLSYMPLQLVGQYAFVGDETRVYGLLGVGLAFNNFSETVANNPITGTSTTAMLRETDFLLSPGLGISFKLSDKAALFVQGKLDIDFYSQNLANWFTTMTDSTKKFDTPQLLLPVQAGLSFSLN